MMRYSVLVWFSAFAIQFSFVLNSALYFYFAFYISLLIFGFLCVICLICFIFMCCLFNLFHSSSSPSCRYRGPPRRAPCDGGKPRVVWLFFFCFLYIYIVESGFVIVISFHIRLVSCRHCFLSFVARDIVFVACYLSSNLSGLVVGTVWDLSFCCSHLLFVICSVISFIIVLACLLFHCHSDMFHSFSHFHSVYVPWLYCWVFCTMYYRIIVFSVFSVGIVRYYLVIVSFVL